jgi:hypothetical protein
VGGALERLAGQVGEQRDRVAVDALEEVGVEALEEGPRLGQPAEGEVVGDLRECLEELGDRVVRRHGSPL